MYFFLLPDAHCLGCVRRQKVFSKTNGHLLSLALAPVMLQMAIFTKYCFHNSAPSQHYHPRDEPLVWVALTASLFRQKMCFGNENKLPTWQQRWSKVQLLLRILGHSSSRTSLVPVPSLPSASSLSLWAPTNPRILQLAPVQMEQSRPRSFCRAPRRSGHAGTRT